MKRTLLISNTVMLAVMVLPAGVFAQAQEQPSRRGTSALARPLITPALESQLGLTAEQREKLAQLQRETEAKVRGLLTEDQQKRFNELSQRSGGFGGFGPTGGSGFFGSGPLIAQNNLDRLALNAEQKEKLARVEQEFANKNKSISEETSSLFTKYSQNRDDETRRALTEKLSQGRTLRSEYLTKARDVLTEEQRKTLDELVRSGGPGRSAGFIGGSGGFSAPGVAPTLVTPATAGRLALTAEQKRKVDAMQAEYAGKYKDYYERSSKVTAEGLQLRNEYDGKIRELLTEEQRKAYEEMRSRSRFGGSPRPERR